jgi:hypothetical protein
MQETVCHYHHDDEKSLIDLICSFSWRIINPGGVIYLLYEVVILCMANSDKHMGIYQIFVLCTTKYRYSEPEQ